jgi:hypothetical protein
MGIMMGTYISSLNDAIVSKESTDAAVFHPSFRATNGAVPITSSLISIPKGVIWVIRGIRIGFENLATQ